MRSILLLITVIASSMFAVCSLPVSEPAGTTPGPSSGQGNKRPAEDPPAAASAPAPKKSKQRMTGQIPHGYFTLVNRFGQTMVGGVPLNTTLQRDITKPISNALGLTYKMQDLVTYEGGSYSPMPDAKKVGKEWVYLNVTGLVPECTPCYAWIAKGAKVTSRDGRPEKQGVSKIYVGLSKPGSSAGEWTRIVVFDPKERKCVPADHERSVHWDAFGEIMRNEWERLSERFELVFHPPQFNLPQS